MLPIFPAIGVALSIMGPPAELVAAAGPKEVRVPKCIVTLMEEAQVPAKEPGVLVQLRAKEGKEVQAGAVLGQIDDTAPLIKKEAALLEYDVAREQATNDIRVRAAKAANDVAQDKYKSAQAANVNSSVNARPYTESQLREFRLQAINTSLQIELAQLEFTVEGLTAKVKGAGVKGAQDEIDRRRILAPFSGVVVQLQKHAGEWCAPGEAVLRLVRMDHLRVEGFLSAAEYTPSQVIGREVTVDVTLTRDRVERFKGVVDFASPIVEGAGDFRILAEITNVKDDNGHWALRPGLRGDMVIHLDREAPGPLPAEDAAPAASGAPGLPALGPPVSPAGGAVRGGTSSAGTPPVSTNK